MSDPGVSDLAREAAVEVAGQVAEGDRPEFRRRQAYIVSISSDWKTANIKFPESTDPVPARFMHPSMPCAVGDTVWVDQNGADTVVASAVGVPMGTVLEMDGRLPVPAGWLLCDGRSTSGYPINATIATTPDLRDRFIVGAGGAYANGATGGSATVALSAGEMPSHTHTGPSHTHQGFDHSHTVPAHTHPQNVTASVGGPSVRSDYNEDAAGSAFPQGINTGSSSPFATTGDGSAYTTGSGGTGATGSAGSGTAHENRPPYYALVRIIKCV